jgi:iron complex outermembrane recepter protein
MLAKGSIIEYRADDMLCIQSHKLLHLFIFLNFRFLNMNRVAILFFSLLSISHLVGQSTDDYVVSIDTSINIEDIVISATRQNERAPLTFQNISQAQIDQIYVGQDPVLLIQQLSPSIVSYSDGGTDIGNYSQFRLRGMDQDRVNITLNGVPLNDMVDHGVYFSNFSDFGNSVESIQITRGAGATSTGVASYAGAVNFESINLFQNGPSGSAQLTAGSFGTLRTAAEVSSGTLDNDMAFYTRLSRTQTDGYKYNSGSDSYSLFFSGAYKGDKDMVKLTAFSGKTQNGQSYEHVPESLIELDPRTNFNNLNDVDDFEQHMAQLQYGRSISSQFSYTSTAYFNGAGGVFPYTFDGVQYMYGLDNTHYGLMANMSFKTDESSIAGGLHVYQFDRTNYEYVSPFVTEPYARDYTDKSELSAFLKYERSIDNLNVYGNVELRALGMTIRGDETLGDAFEIENDYTFVNTVLGVDYSIDELSSVYLSYGRSHREPTRSDLFNGVTDAERVNDIELGWKYKSPKLTLNANAYYMNFDNEITKIGALQDQSYIEIRQNVENSIRSGLEVQSNYRVNEAFDLGLLVAFMSSNIESYNNGSATFEDVEHIFAPDWIIQPSVRYQFSDQLSCQLSSRYVSESFSELSNDSDFILPSHFIVNTQLDFSPIDRLNFTLSVNNLFDVLYYTEGSPIDADYDGISEEMGYRVQSPRNAYIMMSYAF